MESGEDLVESNGAIVDTQQASSSSKWFTTLLDWRPHPRLQSVLSRVFLPLFTYATLQLISLSLVTTSPTTYHSTSPVVILLFLGLGMGELFDTVKLPPLLGMLVTGLLLRNVDFFTSGGEWLGLDVDVTHIAPQISTLLRQIALVVILIRAGLGLDPAALLRLKGVVIRLAFCPCLAEAVTVAVASHFVLGFPWLWGLILGFVLAAVSPAVVVPCLLSLRERGYGLAKGIPTIVIAASSVDDILAISAFGLVLGLNFAASPNFWELILQGPLELGAGLGFGIFWGSLLGSIFSNKDSPGENSALVTRTLLTLSGGITALLAFQKFHLPGSGPLGCLVATFVAAIFWRRKGVLGDTSSLNQVFSLLWYVFQPLLFGLIGTEIELRKLEPAVAMLGTLVLLIGLIVRVGVTYLTVANADLNVKERLFVALAWIPKATVQAAIGPLALDMARSSPNPDPDQEELGLKVLTIAVLVILLTAPFGSMAITLLGPKLLTSSGDKENAVRKKMMGDVESNGTDDTTNNKNGDETNGQHKRNS